MDCVKLPLAFMNKIPLRHLFFFLSANAMALTEHMELVEPFEKAGFDKPQAQALAGLVGVINRRFDAVDQRFDAIEQRFDAIEQRFNAIEHRLDGVETEMREMRKELHSLPWKMFTMMLTVAALVIAAQKLL